MRDAIAGLGIDIREMPTIALFCALINSFIELAVSVVPYYEYTPAKLYTAFDFSSAAKCLFNGVTSA